MASRLAADPHIRSNDHLPDDSGRQIEHLLIEDFVFGYCVDHASREIRIVDIAEASQPDGTANQTLEAPADPLGS